MVQPARHRVTVGVALSIAGALLFSGSSHAAQPNSSVALPVDGQSGDPLATPEVPGDLLNLDKWKITLPQNEAGIDGDPDEIVLDAGSKYQHPGFFRLSADGQRVLFRAPVEGLATEHSEFPRSELREMTSSDDPRSEGIGWSTTSGTHVMTLRTRITEVPKVKQHVVVAQIHDEVDDVAMVRWEFGRLFVEANGAEVGDLNINQPLNEDFDIEMRAADGVISISYNGGPPVVLNRSLTGCYFKAGVYTQSNMTRIWDGVLEDPTSAGAVEMTSLTVTHS